MKCLSTFLIKTHIANQFKNKKMIMKRFKTLFERRVRLFMVALSLLVCVQGYSQVNINDSLALVAIYNSTDGQNWNNNTNWLSSSPVSTWNGVVVFNNRIRQLFLNGNNLNGNLPPEIGNLTDLHLFYVVGNRLSGSIPSNIGQMTSLQVFNALGNNFSGTIPADLGNLGNLTELHLNANALTGDIPTQLGMCIALRELNLSKNQLTGSIPPQLGSIPFLEALNLSSNQLSGSIPHQLGKPALLINLSLQNNNLTGTIPSELGDPPNLLGLTLQNNNLTGSIPSELGDLSKLLILDLSNNQLSGSIPFELGGLTNVVNLYLFRNSLTGLLPASLFDPGDLPNLRELKIHENMISGPVPSTIENLSSLKKLYAYSNNFTGTLPSTIGNLSTLETFYMFENYLTGAFPASITNITGLKYLAINDNRLEDLPDISSMTNIQFLDIRNNRFTFEDMIPNVGLSPGSFYYSPQAKLGSDDVHSVDINTSIDLNSYAGGVNNSYEWFKDNVSLGSFSVADYAINNFQQPDEGVYHCLVTNPAVPGLTLCRHNITLTIDVGLPIELISFTAVEHDLNVLVEWATAYEKDNDYFSIERSTDGIRFNTIHQVDGRNEGGALNHYSYLDEQPVMGLSYYRLSQVDFDGAVYQSPIVVVKLESGEGYLFPNPIKPGNSLTFRGNIKGDVGISVIDVSGKVILNYPITLSSRYENVSIPTNGLATGIYSVVVENENQQIVTRLLVK